MPTAGFEPMTVSLDGGEPLFVEDWQLHGPRIEYLPSLEASMPDPGWVHVDSHGHEHRWARGDRNWSRPDALPTLIQSYEHKECDGSCGGVCGGEGYDVSVWHCRVCGDQVEPGLQPDYVARTRGIPIETGPRTAELQVVGPPVESFNDRTSHQVVMRVGDAEFRGTGSFSQVRWSSDGPPVGDMQVTLEP